MYPRSVYISTWLTMNLTMFCLSEKRSARCALRLFFIFCTLTSMPFFPAVSSDCWSCPDWLNVCVNKSLQILALTTCSLFFWDGHSVWCFCFEHVVWAMSVAVLQSLQRTLMSYSSLKPDVYKIVCLPYYTITTSTWLSIKFKLTFA